MSAAISQAGLPPLKDPSLFRQQCYIAGEWIDADTVQTLNVDNPASGQHLGSVPRSGAAETRRAIEAAQEAMPLWLPGLRRSEPLYCVSGTS